MSYKSGYSLVELTIVVGLVAMLALAISSVVLISVTQSTRVRNQILTRQAGDYAVTQIQTMIRNARSVTACNSLGNTITILNPDGGSTNFYAQISADSVQIASNSGSALTPPELTVNSSFNIDCSPSDTDVRLVNLSFDLDRTQETGRDLETPPLHYETSIELRNN